jgi:PAS domain S-box-containing protein
VAVVENGSLKEGEILQRIFDHIPVMINFIDAQGRIVMVNREWERVLGWSLAEIHQETFDLFEVCYPDPDYRREVVRFITESNGQWADFKTVVRCGRVIDTTWSVVHLSDGTFIGFGQDITERKTVSEALRASEAELRALFAAMTDVILVLDRSGRYVKIAPTNPRYLYKPQAELVGKTLHEVLPAQDADFFLSHIATALDAGRMHRVEYLLPIDGTETWFDGSVSPLSADTVLWISRDITEHRRSEEALRQSEERYRMLFENNPSPMYVFALGTLRFLAVNEAAITHYGYAREEFLSMTIKDIRPQEDVPALLEFLANWSGAPYEGGPWRHRKRDGSLIRVEVAVHTLLFDGNPSCLVLVKDVTERKQLEDELRQAQKMEAIGLLAGGIAHDFNNLLTVIMGYGALASGSLQETDPLRSDIEQIQRAGERAASLTRQLLTFSRKQVLQPKVIDLNEAVSEMEKMLRRVIGEDIDLRTSLQPEPARVKADPGQIEQVLMNLAVNARDAMPDGGKLLIETKNVVLDEDYARLHVDVTPGPHVVLTVKDTGAGMNEETLGRIFEPFFTTKPVGWGTGLGLSTVYGIVRQAGGSIHVESAVGEGTTFNIYLKRVDELLDDRRGAEDAVSLRGAETILLAEDDEMVRDLTSAILRASGYRVLEAANGGAALMICERHEEEIHLLLTDVIMPEMNGRELAQRLLDLRPSMQVLYMSGYTADAIAHHGVLDSNFPLLQKPFTPAALAHKVRSVLGTA